MQRSLISIVMWIIIGCLSGYKAATSIKSLHIVNILFKCLFTLTVAHMFDLFCIASQRNYRMHYISPLSMEFNKSTTSIWCVLV